MPAAACSQPIRFCHPGPPVASQKSPSAAHVVSCLVQVNRPDAQCGAQASRRTRARREGARASLRESAAGSPPETRERRMWRCAAVRGGKERRAVG